MKAVVACRETAYPPGRQRDPATADPGFDRRAALLYGLGARAFYQGRERSARWFEEQADEALRRAAEMRRAAEATGGRPTARGETGAERIEADA